jgi:signal transduction histidine kinase/ActR/RegA family two-component response regulator
MIKDRTKVIILSIIAGMIAGFMDALVGYFIFSEGAFWDLLILDVPVHELYVRTFFLISFIVFGFIISSYLSKRKRAEEDLKIAIINAEEERSRSEAIIAGIGDGISIQDTNFRVQYQNEIHKDFTGDHVGEFCYEVYEQRDRVCEGCPVAESFKDGKIHKAERSILTSTGTSYFEITASPLKDPSGNIIAGIEVVREVTERKKLEEQLLHSQKMEAVGRLTGGIAHEFNNIMTAIIGCSVYLKEEVDKDTDLGACADGILVSAERAAELTKGLLAYSRKQATHKRLLSLNKIVLRMEKIITKLISEKIKFKITLTDEDLNVMMDSSQIEQVLMNLVTNAQDAMVKGGELSIRTDMVELDSEFIKTHGFGKRGMYALISVEDTGEGMDEQAKEKIFEPFYTTKDVGKGTGLGLSIVYGIIHKHNGYTEVVSERGNGTEFKIYLPLTRIESAGTKREAVTSPPAHGSETILIAEDDDGVRKHVKLSLEKAGYNIIEAIDGEDALDRFMENRNDIDFVLFDVVMPKMSGKDAYEEIIKVRPDVKALFMSGYAEDILGENMIVEEGIDLIPKPFRPEELLTRVREIIDRTEKKRFEHMK